MHNAARQLDHARNASSTLRSAVGFTPAPMRSRSPVTALCFLTRGRTSIAPDRQLGSLLPTRGLGRAPVPAAALPSRRSPWSAAEADLVSIGIAVRDLAHAVRIGFLLRGIESPISDLPDERIEVIDKESVHGVAGVFRLLHNVHVPMLPKLPHRLFVLRKECGRVAQQSFVPFQRRRVVADWDAREQIETFCLNHTHYALLLK